LPSSGNHARVYKRQMLQPTILFTVSAPFTNAARPPEHNCTCADLALHKKKSHNGSLWHNFCASLTPGALDVRIAVPSGHDAVTSKSSKLPCPKVACSSWPYLMPGAVLAKAISCARGCKLKLSTIETRTHMTKCRICSQNYRWPVLLL